MRAAAQGYAPTDILPPGAGYFEPFGLTDAGQVPGMFTPPGGLGQPAVWQDGQLTLLPLLPGTVYGWARNGNSLGHLVGACRSLRTNGTYASHACVWTNGVVLALPEVPATDESSAWAINDAGTIAGNVYSGTNGSFREAVVWKGNSVAKLPPPVTGNQTWARAINSSGQVAVSWAGAEVTGSNWEWSSKPARWTPDVPNGITGTLTPLSGYMSATDINDAGVISGRGSSFYPAVWDGLADIPIYEPLEPYPSDYGWGLARGVNNAGVAVGVYYDPDLNSTAWVWDAQHGTADLNWILNGTSGHGYPGHLVEAVALNDAGQIVVKTADYGYYVMLTPSTPPPALSIQRTTTNTIVVSWPSPSAGFVLQQNTSGVSSVNWSNVTDTIQDDGTTKTLIINPIQPSRFYRLIRP